ncbi:MAG TPA: single-stranded-DNA-specific exonuclease RecJ, partial [Pontiella sp.]
SQVETYLNPLLKDLSDPFLLPDMDVAVRRLWRAIDNREMITVFGDYDVDGVTSSALLTRVLSTLGGRVQPFIPDRMDEGYGLSQEALARCLEEYESSVVVSVDCGVNSVESVRWAQEKGVDVIVTDHHEPEEETASAFALINPKLGSAPDLKNLSGVGVAFKLAHGLLKVGRDQGRSVTEKLDLKCLLDIAALGTVADVVPLVGENRIIVRHGLACLDKTRWVGLQALKEVSGVKGDPNTYHLGFQLGPRINAAGRIGQPMQALHLLLTEDKSDAYRIAKLLDDTNTERRRIEGEMAEEAFAEIDSYFNPEKHFGLVVTKKGWHPGVVGIVASRVARHYNRPSIVMGIEEDGSARGSCRSVDEYNILDGLESCSEHLTKFGGHKMAAGLEVKPGEVDVFRKAFNRAVKSVLHEYDLTPSQHIDAVISEEQLDWSFYEHLRNLRPFGQNNPEPIWALKNVQIASKRSVGKNHLKLVVKSGIQSFNAIAFNYPIDKLPSGNLDIAFTLQENNWNGNSSLQLQVKDIRIHA